MSTSCTFQTELVAIMEVLTKAAVTEISKLVDEGYAVLRLEISRSRRENEELKQKLTLAIPTDPKRRTPQGSFCNANINTGDCGVHLYRDELKTPKEGDFTKPEGVFDELPSRHGDGECARIDNRGNCNAKSLNTGAKSQLIKVEWLEDDLESSNAPQGLSICGKRALESDGGERVAIVDTLNEPAIGTEQHGIGQIFWEDDTLSTVLKAEPMHESVNLQDARSEHTAGRVNSRGHEYTVYDRPVQVGTFFTQRNVENETEAPTCSYPTEPNKETLSGPRSSARLSKLVYGNAALERHDQRLPSTTQRAIDTEHPSCSYSIVRDGKNHVLHSELEGGQNLSPLESNSDATDSSSAGVCGNDFVTSSSPKTRCREKRRLICALCGKLLSCVQTLEAHLRIHTGERPYGCTYCGKKFNQMSNLRTHQRTHTGQKPYCCIQCGKRFSDPGYLKRHQYVHTGERPFKCAECGKSFSFSNNLIRHRNVHTVKII